MHRVKLSILLSTLLVASPVWASCRPLAQRTTEEQARALSSPSATATAVETNATVPADTTNGDGADANVKGQVIWTGESGGFRIKWTTADLSATPVTQPSTVVFSARRAARVEALAGLGEQSTAQDWPYSDYQRTYNLLSVVGSLLSIEDELVYANPGTYMTVNYRVIDLTHPAQAISLADLFPEDELLKALLADKVIQTALATAGVTEPPRTLAMLVQTLDERHPKHTTGSVYFERGLLTHFAFHSVKNGKVAVRLGVP